MAFPLRMILHVPQVNSTLFAYPPPLRSRLLHVSEAPFKDCTFFFFFLFSLSKGPVLSGSCPADDMMPTLQAEDVGIASRWAVCIYSWSMTSVPGMVTHSRSLVSMLSLAAFFLVKASGWAA